MSPRSRRPAATYLQGFLALLALGCCLGCSSREVTEQRGGRLPFVVHLKRVVIHEDLSAGGEGALEGLANPALFGDADDLTATLADALEKSGLFCAVVTGDSAAKAKPDLELEVTVTGDDFGPGEAMFGGAALSSFLWLFTGHLSWVVDDRIYPQSNVILHVALRTTTPAEESDEGPVSVFSDDLFVRNLELSLIERADTGGWFLNILLPPWVGDGDPAVAGRSLAAQTIEYFERQEPERIGAGLPALHLESLSCFLVHDREEDEVILVTRKSVDGLEVRSGTATRMLGKDEVLPFLVDDDDPAAQEEIQLRLAKLGAGIGTAAGSRASGERYYAIPLSTLLAGRGGYVRVQATLEQDVGRWTIYRSGAGRAKSAPLDAPRPGGADETEEPAEPEADGAVASTR